MIKNVKSIIDGIPVVDKAFPLNPNVVLPSQTASLPESPVLEIVSRCPTCGSPIYGNQTTKATEVPVVVRTCICSQHRAIQDRLETK